jgi:hypothetical protein
MNLKDRWGVGFLRHHANHDRFPKQAGNWVQDEARRVYSYPSIHAADRKLIAECQSEALAQVISCLPEMLSMLKPFASLLSHHHDQMPDDRPVFGINHNVFTVGDLRRARDLIEKLEDL